MKAHPTKELGCALITKRDSIFAFCMFFCRLKHFFQQLKLLRITMSFNTKKKQVNVFPFWRKKHPSKYDLSNVKSCKTLTPVLLLSVAFLLMPPSSFGETSKIEPCVTGFSLKVETYKNKIFLTTRPSHSVLLYSISDNVHSKKHFVVCCVISFQGTSYLTSIWAG